MITILVNKMLLRRILFQLSRVWDKEMLLLLLSLLLLLLLLQFVVVRKNGSER